MPKFNILSVDQSIFHSKSMEGKGWLSHCDATERNYLFKFWLSHTENVSLWHIWFVTHPYSQCHIFPQKYPIVMNEISMERLTHGISNDMKLNLQNSTHFPIKTQYKKFPNFLWGVCSNSNRLDDTLEDPSKPLTGYVIYSSWFQFVIFVLFGNWKAE